MDFLDPKKTRRHNILLYSGYILIGIAILISTLVLVYQANGFGVNSKGQVVQNGLVFFSSQPNPADIYLNGERNKEQTNTRLSLPAGNYSVTLAREGYRDWKRNINVQGGDVQHYDYPFLFPKELKTENTATYQEAPGLATQSRDRRWLMVQQSPTAIKFDVYDLKNPDEAAKPLALPASVVGLSGENPRWETVQWANDNEHVLLKHTVGDSSEYILVNRVDPAKAVNLNQKLDTDPVELTLVDNRYNRYHLFNPVAGTLSTATLEEPALIEVLDSVLEYKDYGTKTVLYATNKDAPEGKTRMMILVDDKKYTIRDVPANTTYLLDMAGYRGSSYVVIGATAEGRMYVYKDPIKQLDDESLEMPLPLRAIEVANPTFASFSPSAQYVMMQGGTRFAVYDIFLKRAYAYTHNGPLDVPQQRAQWMDGNRLTYVSKGKTIVFDYDHRNQQTLMSASAGSAPFFSSDYKYVYAFAPGTAGAAAQLTQTALLTEADL